MSNLLDYVGLGYFLEKIKTLFVTALGTSGKYLTWTKNGTTNNITIPYATKSSELVPLQTKQYTGIIGTANDLPGATFYFMSVLPLDRVKPCTVKYRIYASMEGQADGIEESIVTMTFSKNTVLSYDVWNYVANGSYRPYYYHYRYLSTLAGHNSGYGHLVGVGMRYSYNPATAANARTYVIDILDIRGGTVTFFDTMLKFANVPGTGATNYSGESTYDATTNGETHSGDRNDVNYYNREYYGCRKTNSALYRYMLCLTKSDSSLVPLNSISNSVATNKTLTTDSFDPFGEILFWNTTTTYAAGANVGDGWYRLYMCDLRYSFNCGGYNTTSTLVGRLPLYLVAVPQSNGTAVLYSEPLSLTLPNTENGLIYIYLGTIYPDTYPYRLNLALVHPIYYYKDLAVRLWTGRSYVSLETDPVFSASPAANITSANITSWNGKVDKVTSTDNAVVRFDGTSGAVQNSGVTINDSNHVTAAKFITSGGTSSQMVRGDGSLSVNYLKDGSVATPASAMGNLGNLYTSQLNNAFYALHLRKTITQTGFASFEAKYLFDNRYDVGTCKINAGGTGVITIGATTDSIFTTYTYGSIYVTFYTESTKGTAQSVSIRAYGTKSGTVGWYNYDAATNPVNLYGNTVSNCFKCSQNTIYNIKAWEITIVAHSTLPTYVCEIFAIFTRTNGEVDQSVVTKYANAQDLYGNLTAPKFITRGGTSSQFVKGDGSLDSTSYGTYSKPSGGIPKTDLASAVLTSLGKADTALLSYTETDPTVPSWAKQSSKPTYTAQEVGALPSTTSIPSKTSDLTNDSGFITTSDISGVYKYKGTKTNYSNLPTSGNVTGDVWNVTNANGNIPAGTNYAWNGSAWDALGGSVDLSGYVPTSRTINGKPLSANVTLSASDVSALSSSTTIPTALADLTDDSTHRVVTDTEKSTWNGKLNPATTLAGYGITDAKIQNGVITLGSNTITPLTSHLSLSNYVNLNGAQSITGEKTFTGDKRIKFKLGTASDKLGFTLYTQNNVETGYLEWQSSGLDSKPTLVLGLWISLLKPSTPGYLGFKLVNVLTATRYMLVTPLLADAKTPLELNDTIKTFYFPLLFKNGTAKVVTANTGEVDLSTLMLAYESTNNKVTSIDSSSTDTLYPSAKCVYEAILDNSLGDYVFVEGTDIYADFTPTSSNFSFVLGASNYNDF